MTTSLATAYVDKSKIYNSTRPSYPEEAVKFIKSHLDLSAGLPVLDVGSGTGILSRQLAAVGMPVIGVEPDEQMLAMSRQQSVHYTGLSYIQGSAEQLEFCDHSVAALVCGQSFHWFEPDYTRAEFARVLATNNPVFLIWNIRSTDYDPFHVEYEHLLQGVFSRYAETLLIDNALEEKITHFFGGNFQERIFHNSQRLDAVGLLKRTMSCSYAPQRGTPEYREANVALNKLHQEHHINGEVRMSYTTRIVYGII